MLDIEMNRHKRKSTTKPRRDQANNLLVVSFKVDKLKQTILYFIQAPIVVNKVSAGLNVHIYIELPQEVFNMRLKLF